MWEVGQDVWRPAIEIAILAVAIYYSLRFIRGTRRAPVVTGFLVLLLAFALVTYLLNLKVLQYLLGAFSAFFILAVLVAGLDLSTYYREDELQQALAAEPDVEPERAHEGGDPETTVKLVMTAEQFAEFSTLSKRLMEKWSLPDSTHAVLEAMRRA